MTDNQNSENELNPPAAVTACTVGSDNFCQEVDGCCLICGRTKDVVDDSDSE